MRIVGFLKKSSYTNKPQYTTILIDFQSIVRIVGIFSRVSEKKFSKKSWRGSKHLQFVKNRLELAPSAANHCRNFSKKVPTGPTIIGISHFFFLQF